jgi:chitinase
MPRTDVFLAAAAAGAVLAGAAGLADAAASGSTTSQAFGAYFANWAQYHAAPYTHLADNLAGISPRTDEILFGFVYFCPPSGTSPMPYWASSPFGDCTDDSEFQLMTVESNDPASMATLVGQGAKVMASIGGWNFPSSYFSAMVATAESRGKFIASAKAFLDQYNLAGIDLDWCAVRFRLVGTGWLLSIFRR